MEEEIVCPVCDTKCTLTHEEEDRAVYCPFCGNILEEEDELDGWDSIEEEPYED